MDMDSRSWIITGSITLVLILLAWWGIAHLRAASPVVGSENAKMVVQTDADGTQTAVMVSADEPTVTKKADAPTAPTARVQATATAVAGGETVTTSDQAAGSQVTISQATLTRPSWIAIKDTKGWVIGAGWFAASGENLSVPLLRATKAGEVYQAVVYADNGDKKFDLHADTLLTSAEGAPLSSTFRAQ